MKKTTLKNFHKVLDNIKQQFDHSDKEQKQVWVDEINNTLDNLLAEDFFGTEGQLDPRGDQRD